MGSSGEITSPGVRGLGPLRVTHDTWQLGELPAASPEALTWAVWREIFICRPSLYTGLQRI